MNNPAPKIFRRELFAVLIAFFIVLLLLSLFYIFYAHDDHSSGWRSIPLPEFSSQPLHLNVAHVINPRFAVVEDEQLAAILERSEQLAYEHFGVRLELHLKQSLPISEFFQILPEHVTRARQGLIVDPHALDDKELARMRHSLVASMQETGSAPQLLIDYARPYLMSSRQPENLTDLASAVIDAMLVRIRYWYGYRAEDGKPVLDGSPYNQWVWWDSMGYGELPFDVVITNQLVASLENYDQELHSALRGGINGGTMTYSRQSPYLGYVFVSLYPMINDNPMLAQLKNDRRPYSREQLVDYAAATLTHELGHLLFHYGHPFGVPACIMAPTPLLKYREWYAGLDAQACRAAAHGQMEPGAAEISYNPAW